MLSIFGNVVVVYIILYFRRRICKIFYVFLVFNLVICDIIIFIISIFIDWIFEEYDYRWIFGVVLCKFFWFF